MQGALEPKAENVSKANARAWPNQRVSIRVSVVLLAVSSLLFLIIIGCTRYREDLAYDHAVEYSWSEPGTTGEFSLFEGVAWDGAVAPSATSLLAAQSLVDNRKVLELFSGPGVIAVLCGYENPKQVLSIAESEVAAACTRYNVAAHQHDSIVKVQPFDPAASPPIPPSDRFDILLTTLSLTRDEAGALPTSDRVKVLLQCVDGNLVRSGRAFAICEPGATVEQLTAACEEAGKELVLATTDATRWPVYEIKSSTTIVGEPEKTPF